MILPQGRNQDAADNDEYRTDEHPARDNFLFSQEKVTEYDYHDWRNTAQGHGCRDTADQNGRPQAAGSQKIENSRRAEQQKRFAVNFVSTHNGHRWFEGDENDIRHEKGDRYSNRRGWLVGIGHFGENWR